MKTSILNMITGTAALAVLILGAATDALPLPILAGLLVTGIIFIVAGIADAEGGN